jgi:hypothetical protein
MPVIPALRKQRPEEDGEFETILGYIARPCLKKQNKILLGFLSYMHFSF